MFQYAAGRALALRNGAELKIDTRLYALLQRQARSPSPPAWGRARSDLRQYELHVYPVCCTPVTDDELFRFSLRFQKRRRFYHNLFYKKWKVAREPHFHFDPAVTVLKPPVYLSGFWQSERYFGDIADVLRREFTPSEPLDPQNAAIASQIRAVDAVSIHVRRGDYVTSERTNRAHGTCSLDYYHRAVEFMAARVGVPHLFVFSDEPEWAQRHLYFNLPTTYVATNPSSSGFRDLQLMSGCRHHVIANSSFSWWGAWLNSSPDKIVVAPKRWFNELQHDTRDLVPEGWIRI